MTQQRKCTCSFRLEPKRGMKATPRSGHRRGKRGYVRAGSVPPRTGKCATPCLAGPRRAEGSSAAVWVPPAPIAVPVAAEKRDRPDVPPFRRCAGCCTRGTRHDICRSRRSGNRADTRRSKLGRSHARECRIRDIGERCARHGPAVLRRPLRWRVLSRRNNCLAKNRISSPCRQAARRIAFLPSVETLRFIHLHGCTL